VLGPQQTLRNPPNALSQIIDSVPAPTTPLNGSATPEQIIGLMLHSHTTWRTLQGEATISWFNSSNGSFESTSQTIELQQFGKVRIENRPADGEPGSLWVSDGANIWSVDYATDTTGWRQFPVEARSLQTYGPPAIPTEREPIVIFHPVASQMPTMLADYVYPLGFAQGWRQQAFTIVGVQPIAGRQAVKVQFAGGGILAAKKFYWVDAITGVVLKGQEYAVGQDGIEHLMTEVSFNTITYDVPVPADRFANPDK
jgi:hypothetical protein